MLLDNVFSRKYRTPAERAHFIREAKRHERRTAYERDRIERITQKMDARDSGAKPVSLTTEWRLDETSPEKSPRYVPVYYITELPIKAGLRKRIRERNIRQIARGTIKPYLAKKYGVIDA